MSSIKLCLAVIGRVWVNNHRAPDDNNLINKGLNGFPGDNSTQEYQRKVFYCCQIHEAAFL